MPLAKDTELVAFGVGQDNPRLLTLANIDTLCAVSHQASHLGVLVIRPEVEMQRLLAFLLSSSRTKSNPGRRSGSGRISNSSSEEWTTTQPRAVGPPLPQGHRIAE